jgi:signal transduction histidine kinase
VLPSLLSSPDRVRIRPRTLLWPAAAFVGLAAESALYGWDQGRDWVPDLVTGWSLIGCGLVAWQLRSQDRPGLLMTASGFAWFAPNFARGSGVIAWLGAHALYLHRGPLLQLVLTYPGGRAKGRLARAAVAAGYGVSVVTVVWQSEQATIGLAALLVGVAAHGYLPSVGRERRERLYALGATVFLAAVLALTAGIRLAVPTAGAARATLLLYQLSLCALAYALLSGLARTPWARADMTDLVVELGETRAGTLRDRLARALGDPSLQVGYWLSERGGFVNTEGRPLELPDAGSGRASTLVERDGRPVALLVHDQAVLDDPGLIEAVSSATRLGVANARLQAEVRARLEEIAASRRRILEAGDEERRRLERRLREGAERRLDALASLLARARRSATGDATIDRICRSQGQLERTQDELRRLARGIHPRELTDQGLAAALSSLTTDFPSQIALDVAAIEAPPNVEACAYFVCAEALANITKYASASTVGISVSSFAGAVVVEVSDDGVGGADPGRGTGLRGLADRVEALGGTLSLDSRPGSGTRLRAVIPTR